jgi:uncharacterized protein
MAKRQLTKDDARRALVAYHLRPGSLVEVIDRLRSVQYDPLSPAGCNHDLVLQARVPGYRIGDWQHAAYQKRYVYDGWDKQACLIPMQGWPLRRIYHRWSGALGLISVEHPHAVKAVLGELEERGPLAPKEFRFQERREDLEGSWYGPNLTKHVLRALWHAGMVMTTSRRGQHHVYDLTERIVPKPLLEQPELEEEESIRELLMERHLGVGLLRPTAQPEVWSMRSTAAQRREAVRQLVEMGRLIPVDIEGVEMFAVPELLASLDTPLPAQAAFIAPLDQIMWDRKMIGFLFGFDYLWEVYKPASQRKWGYYVLPVLAGDRFVARCDVWARGGVLEIRSWHWEPGEPASVLTREAVGQAFTDFMAYCGADEVRHPEGLELLPPR